MPVSIQQKEGVMTVLLKGEIDHHTARSIREDIDELASRTKPGLLQLDFSGVSFMDSSGIGLVMGRYKLVKALGGQTKVVGASGHMKKIMIMAGFERLGVMSEEVKEGEKADE